MSTDGVKRKCDGSPDIEEQSLPTTAIGIMEKAKQIMEAIRADVENTKDTDKAMTSLKSYIGETISNMEKGRRKATIVISGRTGEGKSSLLNAVLEEEGLLPSGNFGACTAVITQVEANLNDSNYIAEIELISEEEWTTVFAFLKKEKEIDQEIITALFGDNAVEKTSEELKRDSIYAKIDEILSSPKNRKTILNSERSEFVTEVTHYIQNNEEQTRGWFWPLVKSVTIKIPNCCELLEHIVLVDLPGTGDCNKIRNDLWKSKLKECSSVWIVSNIQRAISDDNAWGILNHCIEELGPGGECKSINIICTHTAANDRSTQFTEEEMKTRTLQRNKRAKETIAKKMKIKMEELQERFTTDVFTVDSIAYFDHTSHLTRTETEIPRLHDVLRSLNKSINQKLTRDYVNEAKGVLSLVQSVQLDTDENMTKAEVQVKLEKNLKEALKILDGHFDSLYTILERSLDKSIKESVDSRDLTTEDMFSSVHQVNGKINYNTYQAMCRKNGCHWPKNWIKTIDLNKYLSKYMNNNIKKEFKWMFPGADDHDKNLPHKDNKRKSVKEKLDEFSIISTAPPKSPMLYHLENFIKTQENILKESLSRDILDRKKEIYSSIFTVIQENMTPGYQEAADQGERGAQQRMEEIISRTIRNLKPQMFNQAKERVLELFQYLKGHVHQTLNSKLKISLECSLSQTGKITQLDVPKMIQELDTLLEQLSNV